MEDERQTPYPDRRSARRGWKGKVHEFMAFTFRRSLGNMGIRAERDQQEHHDWDPAAFAQRQHHDDLYFITQQQPPGARQ
jgi:hypothetical protein